MRSSNLTQEHFIRSDHKSQLRIRGRRTATTPKSIEKTGEPEEVFCAIVPEHHNFTLSNGVVTGNCLDLPPKVYESIDVEMTKDQWRVYREMEEHLIARLREGSIEIDDDDLEGPVEDGRVATAITQVVMMMRLTTITSGFVKDENTDLYRFDPNPKLDALEEIVSENIRDQQIIVWARYRENIRAICERLVKYSPVIIQGGQKQAERDYAEQSFQSGESRLLVANPAAGGVGLNLQAASLAVYYSQGYSLEHRIQSEDRCHRSGSERHSKVTYIDLVATGTIDRVVADALLGKKSVADIVVDLRRALGV